MHTETKTPKDAKKQDKDAQQRQKHSLGDKHKKMHKSKYAEVDFKECQVGN